MVLLNIEAYPSFFLTEVNHVDKKNFDRKLANIMPRTPKYMPFSLDGDVFHSMKLHPTHEFTWKYETMGEGSTNTIRW